MSAPEGLPPTVAASPDTGITPATQAGPPVGAALGLFGLPGYEIIGELGRGGMGVVYRARQVAANRLVALKMVLSGQLASADEVARFRAEAESAAALHHPHIVPIFEVGEYQGQHYYAMKIIEGPTLDGLMPQLVKSPRDTAALLAKVARAVHYAHQRGVLHRDLKPANVLIDEAGEPYVADFGLARRLEGNSELSRSGAIIGTPGYMSPEQAAARKGLSVAVDVYGLGAVLYEMLTGRPPFREASTVETVLAVLERDPVPPSHINPGVPRDLETICLKCLQKEPEKRYASAVALADDLQRWLDGEPIVARPVNWGERAWKWASRRPAIAALLALLALTIVAGAAGVVWQWREALDARKEADARAKAEGKQRQNADRERRKAVEAGKKLASAQTATQEALVRVREESGKKDAVLQEISSLHLAAEARSAVEHDTVLALLLGAEAVRRSSNPLSWGILHRALNECREERQLPAPSGGGLVDASYGGAGAVRLLARDRGVPAVRTDAGNWVRLRGPANLFGKVALSPDGKRVVTVVDDHVVVLHPDDKEYLYTSRMAHVWDAATGKELFRLRRHDNRITSVDFSPDSKHILTASWDGTARLWDASSGKQGAVFRLGKKRLHLARFSPDGSHVLTLLGGGADLARYPEAQHPRPGAIDPPAVAGMRVRPRDKFGQSFSSFGGYFKLTTSLDDPTLGHVWSWKDNKTVALKPGKKWDATRAAISPDNELVAIGTADGATLLFDTISGKEQRVLASDSAVRVLTFTRGRRLLLTGHADGAVRIWQVSSGKEQRALKGHRAGVQSLSLSRDGSMVLSTAEDARLWELGSGKGLAVLRGHAGTAYHGQIRADGRQVLTRGGNSARLWSVQVPTLERVAHTGEGKLVSLEYAEDGRLLFAEGEGNVWSLPAGGAAAVALKKDGELGDVQSARFCQNGTRVVTASKACEVWINGTRRSNSAVHILDARTGADLLSLTAHKTGALDARVSADGMLVFTVSSGSVATKSTGLFKSFNSATGSPERGTLRVWSSEGRLIRTLPHDAWEGGVPPLTRDGRYLLVSGWKAEQQGLMDAETGKIVRRLEPVGKTRPTNLSISPDGNWFASDGKGTEPRVYRADTGKVHMKFSGLPGRARLSGYSGDGTRLLMVAGPDVCVWDIPGRRLVALLRRPRDAAALAVFSPDGKLVAVGYSSGTIDVYEANTGRLRTEFPSRGPAPSKLAFRPDVKELASVVGGTLRLWPIDPWPFIRSRCPRELTKEERVRYALDEPLPGEEKRPVAVAP